MKVPSFQLTMFSCLKLDLLLLFRDAIIDLASGSCTVVSDSAQTAVHGFNVTVFPNNPYSARFLQISFAIRGSFYHALTTGHPAIRQRPITQIPMKQLSQHMAFFV
jgi:hypothetical protein